jgi:periplasmic protein CpxP/Spy
MQKDKFLILTIVILFALNLFTLGYVLLKRDGPPPHHINGDMRDGDRKGPPGRPDEVIINRLKLNDAQIKQFEMLKKEHRSQVEPIQEASRKLHDEYFGLLKQDKVDSVKANQILEQIANNQKELDRVTFKHFEKIKGICDSSQKELFSRFIDEIAGSFKPPKPPR